MCRALLAHDCHPYYSLVLVANRDEFHARPTEAARWRDAGKGVAIATVVST